MSEYEYGSLLVLGINEGHTAEFVGSLKVLQNIRILITKIQSCVNLRK